MKLVLLGLGEVLGLLGVLVSQADEHWIAKRGVGVARRVGAGVGHGAENGSESEEEALEGRWSDSGGDEVCWTVGGKNAASTG